MLVLNMSQIDSCMKAQRMLSKVTLFGAAEQEVQCQPFRKQEQSRQGTRSRVATKHDKRFALLSARIESQVHRPELKRISCWHQASGPPVHHRNGHPGNRSRGAMRENTVHFKDSRVTRRFHSLLHRQQLPLCVVFTTCADSTSRVLANHCYDRDHLATSCGWMRTTTKMMRTTAANHGIDHFRQLLANDAPMSRLGFV